MSDSTLKRFALFAGFGADDLEEVLQVLEPQALPADRTLFRAGEESDGLVLLVEGTLRLESRRTRRHVCVGAGSALGL